MHMKKKSTRMKELLMELRHWQMWYRIETNGLERTKKRILETARKMRELQKEKEK